MFDGKSLMKLRIPPLLQFLFCAGLGWMASRLSPGLDYDPGLADHAIAAGLALAGAAILAAAVAAFLIARTTVNPVRPTDAGHLVTTGLYRVSRNPMYLGFALVLTSLAIWTGNGAALLAPVVFVAAMTVLQIEPEEKALKKKFGSAYDVYCRRTRRWL
ncbi:methyltransferase family protein [Henriciella marina]|jgi:protein-S-isoprenylcysteine O-methyltransferase Ste14|uniref:Isoprenylcysteine carboxylmethyltransferase family protein n=1 Tax=Henriciella marina TaxID=453851 RepID=A0ABT4LYS7_9PROT|nr:isoprenylcysteine carboxylmethyltransferase family protein [Henriciella marina]MCH2459125.1 isoprenylcysteine carboxylmethyltransferase family protein [Henriciella sp.]MCZ4299535.1 isoprenylcysteine carboxylmethyltransferase family protein [Henriciella marina]